MYKDVNQIITECQQYPMHSLQFLKLQQKISNNFHDVAVSLWQENIIRYVKKVILDNFNNSKKSLLTKDAKSINPYIKRFFKSIYQMQVSKLFAKHEKELRSYLVYLLQFANLSDDFRA